MNMEQFIAQLGFDFSFAHFCSEVDAFQEEMRLGLDTGSSLKMIPSYIQLSGDVPHDRTVLAMDMGGTNMRVAKVHFDADGKAAVLKKDKFPMPGTKGALTKDAFFAAVAEHLRPFMDKSYPVGLCFSFPCEILPNMDGKIINFNKEVCVSDAGGAILGASINQALLQAGLPAMESVIVINDTVAALLGGKAAFPEQPFASYIGLILGTGTNSCYVEQNRQIVKNPYLRDRPGASLVNLESGGYAKVHRTGCDLEFDASTDAPGTQLLEKMISGAYIGGLFHSFLMAAVQAGCFSDSFTAQIRQLKPLESHEVGQLLDKPSADNRLLALAKQNQDDLLALQMLADAFFSRSAMMVAVNLTAVMRKSGVKTSPEAPICISAEGSTFYLCKPLHDRILKFMDAFAHQRMQLNYAFVQAEDSTIFGSAYAALSAK